MSKLIQNQGNVIIMNVYNHPEYILEEINQVTIVSYSNTINTVYMHLPRVKFTCFMLNCCIDFIPVNSPNSYLDVDTCTIERDNHSAHLDVLVKKL